MVNLATAAASQDSYRVHLKAARLMKAVLVATTADHTDQQMEAGRSPWTAAQKTAAAGLDTATAYHSHMSACLVQLAKMG